MSQCVLFTEQERSKLTNQVYIAVALNVGSEGGYFDSDAFVYRVFETPVNSIVRSPGTLRAWVDASMEPLDLVLIVSDTRLETADGDKVHQSDPPLVPTAVGVALGYAILAVRRGGRPQRRTDSVYSHCLPVIARTVLAITGNCRE